MRELTVDELVEIHELAIRDHGGGDASLTVAARHAMGSVLHSASYRSNLLGYAAAILCFIARAQHFTDGNKRTAWGGCVRALEINGFTLEVEVPAAAEYVVRVANHNLGPEEVANQLADWLVELPPA